MRQPVSGADFVEPMTVKFKMTSEGDQTIAEVMVMAPNRMRMEQEMPNHCKMVVIGDGEKGKHITLIPAQKLAIVTTHTNTPKEKGRKHIYLDLWSQLAGGGDRPDYIREPLGEKDIDGRRLVGCRLTGHGSINDLWGDPQTGMPVRVESSWPSAPNAKPTIWSDFVFNVDLDESLFSLEPPADYRIQKQTLDYSTAEETDLLETFRHYGQLSGGLLPEQLDLEAFAQLFSKNWMKSDPISGFPSEEEMQGRVTGLREFVCGLSFAFKLPREADAHYGGNGAKLGAADTPIFWYRPSDANTYRIIYADLSIREADEAPSVANAQTIVSASGPGKSGQ